MNANEAACAAIEAVAMDESAESMAFNDAFASSGSASIMINDDGSIDLTSGDAKVSVPAEAIMGPRESTPPVAPEGA